MYRDVQIYKVEETRRAFASQGFVNLGELGYRDRPHSGAISFVTNIDLVRVAAKRDILPRSHLENISGFCCNTPRYDNFAVWRQEQVLGDGACPGAARVEPDWRGSRDRLFYSYFRAFQGGDRLLECS
ncbi:hypothetical protein [Microcoleus sp. N3A4]|uniref:hypothetical protein n=1 Tax=Microcoleus sp. N3A4 TaxID=3055379 RepID=UPI002FCF4420